MTASARPVVLFVINSLSCGGAERVMSRLLGLSADWGKDTAIHLAILDKDEIVYPIPDWVTVHQLDARRSFWRSVRQLSRLNTRLHPAARFSFLTRSNVANCLVGARGGTRRILSERTNTSAHLGTGARASLVKRLVRWTYPLADRVIAVSRGVSDELVRGYGVDTARISVVPNPVDVEAIRRDGKVEPAIPFPPKFVVAMGRLVAAKNQAMLIRAFAAAALADTSLVIIGEGPERSRLEELSRDLGIADHVILPGFLANPYAVFARAHAFALSSDVEGFPNALVEAMALGIPAVATNCPDGPAEILADRDRREIDGFHLAPAGILVPCDEPLELARGLRALNDETVRAEVLAGAARRLDEFEPQLIAARYWQIIQDEMATPLPGLGRSATPSPALR